MKKEINFERAEEIVDSLISCLDGFEFTTQSAINQIDDYRDIIRRARNKDNITGDQFGRLMTKLGPLRARSLAKEIRNKR